MLGFIATGLLVVATSDFDPFLWFSKSPAREKRATKVEVDTRHENGRLEYVLRRTVIAREVVEVRWTDSRRCPSARWVVEAAIKVPPPRMWAPGVQHGVTDGEVVITADGVWYELSANARYDANVGSSIRFGANVGTPLALWAEESLRSLESCWAAER